MTKLVKHDLRFKDLDGDGDIDYIRFTGGGAHVVLGIGYLHGGDGADIITDSGTDVGAADKIHGDIIHGDDGDDTLAGENSELFFNSTIIGHDVLNGCGNENDYDAESGDDIIFQGAGIQRMAGFDWAIHKRESQAADYDTNVSIFTNQQINNLRDRFDLVEGLSGWKLNDKLTGRDVVSCIPDLQRWRGPGSTN